MLTSSGCAFSHLRYTLLWIPLKWLVFLLKSRTSTGSLVTNRQFSPDIGPNRSSCWPLWRWSMWLQGSEASYLRNCLGNHSMRNTLLWTWCRLLGNLVLAIRSKPTTFVGRVSSVLIFLFLTDNSPVDYLVPRYFLNDNTPQISHMLMDKLVNFPQLYCAKVDEIAREK